MSSDTAKAYANLQRALAVRDALQAEFDAKYHGFPPEELTDLDHAYIAAQREVDAAVSAYDAVTSAAFKALKPIVTR